MKNVHVILALILFAVPALAQTPNVGVYFNTAGTQNTAVFNGGVDETHTAFVLARAEMLIGGAAFKLTLDPRIVVLGVAYPMGVQFGELATGVEVGLTEPLSGYFGVPVLIATLTLWTGANLIANGEINVVGHPAYGDMVVVANAGGDLFPGEGRTALLTIPVSAGDGSWD